MVDTIRDGLIRKDPSNRNYYRQRAGDLKAGLLAMDAKYETMLATCRTKELMSGGHSAFGYLTTRYGLHYTSAYGFSPSAEPSPQDLIRLSKLGRKHGIRYLFHEELIEPRVAEAIAKESGAHLILLHGAHNITKTDFEQGVTFLQLMERNYEALRRGLECR
jgi:zinc transport system substrate-binding protein